MNLVRSSDFTRYVRGTVWLDSLDRAGREVSMRGIAFEPSSSNVSVRGHVLIVYRQSRASAVRRTIDGQVHAGEVAAGDISLKDSGTTGEWLWANALDVLHVYIQAAFLDRVAAEMHGPGFGRFRLNDTLCTRDGRISDIAFSMAEEVAAARPGVDLILRSMSQQLAVQLVRHHGELHPALDEGGFGATRARQISEYIASNLTGDLSVASLARSTALSGDHFGRLFRVSFGCSPHQYVLKARVARAGQMLRDPSRNMADIAAEAGFFDQSHLSRLFKREVGQAPGAWRAARAEDADDRVC